MWACMLRRVVELVGSLDEVRAGLGIVSGVGKMREEGPR
jgi:hypothetical protein